MEHGSFLISQEESIPIPTSAWTARESHSKTGMMQSMHLYSYTMVIKFIRWSSNKI